VNNMSSKERVEPLHRSPFRAMVQDFSPVWFTWCMNAGIIAILLHQLPYQFRGLHVLSTIAFVIDLVLFIIFSLIFLTRFAWFKRQAYYEITDDTNELALGACWPIAWQTISSLTCLIASNASWGGHAFTLVGYVMWWIGTGWTVAYLLFTFITMIRRHNVAKQKLPPTIVIPAVAVSTAATTGGLIAIYSDNISARLAVPIIIVSFMMVGVGVFMAIMLFTLLLHNLFVDGWPAPDNITSMWMFVGPMGQGAAAIQLLGSAAHTYGRFAGYNKGTFLTETAAAPLDVACIFFALMLTGMGTIFGLIAFYAMIEVAWKRQLKWHLTWNSIIFPTGTLTTSFLLFSIEMDSPAFRAVTTALVILLVLVFLLNVGFTFWNVAKGELLIVRKNPRASHVD
ncbi:Sulfite efflux pump SSU1, partial [Lachnellula suecica]